MSEEPLFGFINCRPLLIALAGPNGAGKSSFYKINLAGRGLPFINADIIASELGLDPYDAANKAASIRTHLLQKRSTFVFETVFSDPVGDKVAFLKAAVAQGYTVLLVFIGLSNATQSEERVTIRVAQGGHDVPTEKLQQRFPRSLQNLQAAIKELPHVFIYDNSQFGKPHRLIAVFREARAVWRADALPAWLESFL